MKNKTSPAVIYAAALVLAACSLLYELLIAQTLAALAANTVVWYSVTIGIYLAAMGTGAILHYRFAAGNLWLRLFRVELLLSCIGAAAVPILHFAHTIGLLFLLDEAILPSSIIFFGSAFVLIVAIGILTGFELPLLIDLGNAAADETRVTNRVLAADYMGSLLGGLLFPLALVPFFSLIVIGLSTAAVNLVVALIALRWFLPDNGERTSRFALGGTIASAILAALIFAQPIDRYFVKNYYFFEDYAGDWSGLIASLQNVEDVFRERSPYQRIDIVHDENGYESDVVIDFYSSKWLENPDQPRNHLLFLNGDFQVTANYEEYYHEFFAHVPIAMHRSSPRQVLVMGAGDGLLIRELIKYPDIERIVHVDLDHKLIDLAQHHPVLLGMNEGALDDPRVETLIDDAYRFIRNTEDTFDAIFLDFPLAEDYNLAKLYSREFYHFVRQRLAKDGFMVFDAPRVKNPTFEREVYLNTVMAAGFDYVRPYVSRIERVNPDALAFLEAEGLTNRDSRFLLIRHSHTLQQGFVIGRNSKPRGQPVLDPRVKMHVLNEERLRLTLKRKRIPLPDGVERDKVNSIFKPTLPDGYIWRIRSRH